MNEGDMWESYAIPVVSTASRVYHMGHRLLKLPAENSWVACGRHGYWRTPGTLVGLPLCKACQRAIDRAKREAP